MQQTDVEFVEQVIEDRGLYSLDDADIAEAVLRLQKGESPSSVEASLIDWDNANNMETRSFDDEAAHDEIHF